MKSSFLHILSVLIIFCLALPLCGCKHLSNDQKFEALSNQFFVDEMSQNQLSCHYSLCHPDKYGIICSCGFGDCSAKARKEKHSLISSYKQQLHSIRYRFLNGKNKLDYDSLSYYLDLADNSYAYELYEEPLSPNNGIQSQLPILLAEYTFTDQNDIQSYLSLLACVPDYFDMLLSFEQEKADAGLFMSDTNCALVIESCEGFLENRDQNFLFSSFLTRLQKVSDLSSKEIAQYTSANEAAVYDYVFPAYENMIHKLTSMLGLGRNNSGLCNYQSGKEYYSLLASCYTGSDKTVDQLFEEIETARLNDMTAYCSLFESKPNLLEQYNRMIWDATTEDGMIAQLLTSMKSDFPEPVTSEYQLSFVEDALKPYLAPAFYITAPYDNCLQNHIYINTAKITPSISYFTTLAHEGFPGHLYQTTMSYDYGLSPMRFCLDFPGYTEGWATYVEMLSYQYAGIDPDVADALRLNQSITLSLYATSDIGIHYYGWNSKDMINFWSKYGISDGAVLKEITQLILSEPGNYLKYYVGYLEFEALKQAMMEQYGDAFSLTAFHEAILRMGPAPFPVLQKNIREYYTP